VVKLFQKPISRQVNRFSNPDPQMVLIGFFTKFLF
jgi:hypothetical protein